MNYTFTSESVSEGHPDKVCDRISDAVLDAFLAEEPEARVAAETFATTNRVVIGGEVGLSDQDKLHDYMRRIMISTTLCCRSAQRSGCSWCVTGCQRERTDDA